MKLQLKGAASTQQMLRQVSQQMETTGARKAVRAGAEVIRDAIQIFAPVLDKKTAQSTSLEPGALKAGIEIGMTTQDGKITAIIGPNKDTRFVGVLVEYGHRQVSGGKSEVLGNGRIRGKGKVGSFTPAHPFVRPGFETSVDDAIAACRVEAANQIEKKGWR